MIQFLKNFIWGPNNAPAQINKVNNIDVLPIDGQIAIKNYINEVMQKRHQEYLSKLEKQITDKIAG